MDNNIETNLPNNITDEENKKIVDNRILEDKTDIIDNKKKINNIDDRISNAKKRIRNLSDMQDNVNEIAKNISKCIDLLSKSIQGPTTNNRFNDMRTTNKAFLIKTTATIEEEEMTIRKSINELYKEKDELLTEIKEQYNKEISKEIAEPEEEIEPEEEKEPKIEEPKGNIYITKEE